MDKDHQRLTQTQTGDAVIRVAESLNQKPASVPVNTAKQGVGEKGIADDTKPKLYKHKIDINGTIVDGYDTFEHIPVTKCLDLSMAWQAFLPPND